ncbi:hypothetical protein HGM15179_010630, partial [Zosterops borbonicus]
MAHKTALCWVDKNHRTNYSEFPALQSSKHSKEIMSVTWEGSHCEVWIRSGCL